MSVRMIKTDLNSDTQKSAHSIRSIFEKSFPFFFIMDTGLKILKTGRSLQKLIASDSNFIDVIGFFRPNIINIKNEYNDILKITDQLCILSLKKSEHNLKLKGTFRLLEDDKMIFLGSPWITKE